MDKVFVFFAVILQITYANKLPDYIHRCKLSDPKFDACALESANKAFATLMKGDPSFGFPQLVPLELPNFDFDLTENINFKLTKGHSEIPNDDVIYTDAHFDFKEKTVFLAGKSSLIKWFVDYESSGKLAGKPFHEKGKAVITFENLTWNSTIALGFKLVDGKKYIEALSGDTLTASTKFEFKPSDQVNLGEPMTDEQRQEYESSFKSIGLEIRKITRRLGTELSITELNLVFKTQPFDEIFLP